MRAKANIILWFFSSALFSHSHTINSFHLPKSNFDFILYSFFISLILTHHSKSKLMEHVCYVLYSKRHSKIYIGETSQLINRFKSHNKLAKKGWTIKYRPWKVVYVEFCDSKSNAIKREKQLKSSRGRSFIHNEILSTY